MSETREMQSIKPLQSLLIKPAGPDCNMACTYCFYCARAANFPETKTHRMNDELLALLIKQAMHQARGRISFAWQGGEPTLMGLEFFQKAVDLQKRHHRGPSVMNGLQTNGLLLDRQWAKFLRKNNFLVGLSLDGPQHVHDRYRKMKNGTGSWAAVMDRVKMLLDERVMVNALSVVNDYSVRFAEETYLFFKSAGLAHMQFIPCLEPDEQNRKKPAAFSVSADALGKFWCTLFDLWLADFKNNEPTTFIRLFDDLFYRYVNLDPAECALLDQCGIYLVVEHNGEVYPCDFFVEKKWKLGHIKDDVLIELLNSPMQTEFGKIKADRPAACRKCQWLNLCYGGCPRERLSRADKKNLLCPAYKTLFAHAHPHLKALAKKKLKV